LAEKDCGRIQFLTNVDSPALPLPRLSKGNATVAVLLNAEQNIANLIGKQNVQMALSIAYHGYVMENSRSVLDDTVDRLEENQDLKMLYLGRTEMGVRRVFRDVKFYMSTKRRLTLTGLTRDSC
jgi:hypothetical protein